MLIGDKDRPIHGNINGLIELKKDYSIDLMTGFTKETFSFESVRALVFVALKCGAKREKEEIDFSIEDVGDWLTPGNMNTLLDQVIHAFVGDIEVRGDVKPGE